LWFAPGPGLGLFLSVTAAIRLMTANNMMKRVTPAMETVLYMGNLLWLISP
jgi:hypothetical protein